MESVFDLFPEAPTITLGRERKLVYGVLAVGYLERIYGSDEVQKAYAEMLGLDLATLKEIPPTFQWLHIVNFLWALLQEDAMDHNEELTATQLRRMLVPHERLKYLHLIVDTIKAFSPPQDPQ